MEKSLVFEEMNVGDKIGRILIFKAKGNYIFMCEKNEDTQLQLIDKRTKDSYKFGRIGEGPGHVLGSIGIIPYNDDIYVCDVQKLNIIKYNIDSVIYKEKFSAPEMVVSDLGIMPFDIACLKDTTFAVLGVMLGMNRLSIIDKNGHEILRGGSLPSKENENVSDLVHAIGYQGRLTTNVNSSKIAVCTQYAGMLQIYQYENFKIDFIKEHIIFLADYIQNGENFDITKQTRWGYLSIDSNDKYIFALYSGSFQSEDPMYYLGNEIHVFDWDGNPVQKLKTDRNLSHICVSEDTLYGYDDSLEEIVFTPL
jgi:hypothetical protein